MYMGNISDGYVQLYCLDYYISVSLEISNLYILVVDLYSRFHPIQISRATQDRVLLLK